MPLYKRRQFQPNALPSNLKDDEEIYYLKLTNEIFRNYDDYFERVILCNSMIWACSLTGKANLTFQEALDSEKGTKKLLRGFSRSLKRALLYLASLTARGKPADVVDDVLVYARDRYFKGEEVLAVIGNLWCKSRVINIIEPTPAELEAYKQEQIEKGEAENNDYLKDDSWGPAPDLFRYEVEELEPDNPNAKEVYVLEAIDVKREKTVLTRDKCKYLLKLAMDYDEQRRKCILKSEVMNSHGISSLTFTSIFVGKPPIFEETLGPAKPTGVTPSRTSNSKAKDTPKSTEKGKAKSSSGGKEEKSSSKPKGGKSETSKPSGEAGRKSGTPTANKTPKAEPKAKAPKVEKLTPQELKQLELERKAKEREKAKAQKKLIADFKKLWFKPKEDLEVEDLLDLPVPDPVVCKIPNELFGDFVMVLEFMNSYSSLVKVRDCFSTGLTFDILERALTKSEIAGSLSDILQLLLKTVFRLQEGERLEIAKEEAATVELEVNEIGDELSVGEAIQQATAAATWSFMYQNTPLYKLSVDHSTITEVLRLHLLAAGAKQSQHSRGSCAENDDPGLYLRLEEPQILKTLSCGTVFDLNIEERLKLIHCLIHQILSYSAVKDIMDDSFEEFKHARISYRALQAAEKRKEAEDSLWRQKLKTDRLIPDMTALKVVENAGEESENDEEKDSNKKGTKKGGKDSKDKEAGATGTPPVSDKPLLTDEQIEAALAKRDKETAKRKQEFVWTEAELVDTINKHERKLGLHPLGRDRAYRRYWVFSTVPGLFVEYDDEDVGECLPRPTPYISHVDLNDVNFVKENMKKMNQGDREGSDKENSSSPSKASKKKSSLVSSYFTKEKETVRPSVFGICTGDKDLCPVHGINVSRPKWSFFWDSEHIDALISGLTPRGLREKDLRQSLIDEKDNLKSFIKKCPAVKLNKNKKFPESITSAPERRPQRTGGSAKNQADPNLGFPCETSIDTILELQLRDLILETEEKIFLGGLGSLKVNERGDWRTAIESRMYKAGTSSLKWGGSKTLELSKQTSTDDEGDSNSMSSEGSTAVKDLSCAILQLQQSVEFKFLKRPLVEKEEDKKKKKGAAESEQQTWKSIWSTGSPLERWQLSLMASTSFSQIFVHFYTFESSVEWSRSVLNARCRICRRKGDPEKMLLCDTCNKGHHAYCLRPPLEIESKNIPRGDWFCVDCRPAEPLPTPSKKRKQLSEEDILDELDSEADSDNYSDERGGSIQRGSKKLRSEEENTEPEVCAECGYGGEVICCDGCPLVYHLLCLNPPKTRVPRGTWHCPECTNPRKNKKKKIPVPKKKTKGGRKANPAKRVLHYSSSEESEAEESEEEEEETNSSTVVSREEQEEEESGEDEEKTLTDGEDDEEESTPRVKVKFGSSRQQRSAEGKSSGRNRRSDDVQTKEDSDSDDDDEQVGRGGKRKSASVAAQKIAQTSKRLRSDSKENESTGESSNDSNNYLGGRKRSSVDYGESSAVDCPKRTRLQRMHTNNKIENGELDNVLLDKLISDVMKQADAWPFLKPVTRNEAPDYHDIVKYPMDLGTIKYKLNSMVYTCNEEFVSDLLLVFTNCFTYNENTNFIYQAGANLKKYCEKSFSKLGISISDS